MVENDSSGGTNSIQAADLSNTQRDQIDEVKESLSDFKQQLLDKFGGYIKAINLLAQPLRDDKESDSDDINVAVIVDDSASGCPKRNSTPGCPRLSMT